MNLLLDTHALLWWLGGETMETEAVQAIADPDAVVLVSAASVWEAAIKAAIGKLQVPESLAAVVVDEGFQPLAITLSHAERAGGLPPHHHDPFDRMLVAQAQVEGLMLVSRDRSFQAYEVSVLRC